MSVVGCSQSEIEDLPAEALIDVIVNKCVASRQRKEALLAKSAQLNAHIAKVIISVTFVLTFGFELPECETELQLRIPAKVKKCFKKCIFCSVCDDWKGRAHRIY